MQSLAWKEGWGPIQKTSDFFLFENDISWCILSDALLREFQAKCGRQSADYWGEEVNFVRFQVLSDFDVVWSTHL